MRTADQVRWGTGGGKRVVPSAKKRGDRLERRPLVGIARERETRADDAALCRRECRTLSQSRMVRPLTASSSESVPCCDGVGRMATSSRTWPGKESRARALDDGSGLIFPSPLRPGRPLSPMTLTKILRDRGLAEWATVHGFRSTFRDRCAETGKPREIAEAALAHTVGGVEGAYFRSDLYARRRVLMDQWASFLTGTEAKVVRLYG